MRGIISGAMLMALQDLGLDNVFDAVYGASAGAINATYFLSGQKHGLQIYSEELTRGGSFIDFSYLLRGGRPVMNLDYLIDDVMHNVRPLNWDSVLESPIPLKVVASCLDTLQPVLLSDFESRAELVEALKASATVPQLGGPPRSLRGRRLVDAAVFEPVPVSSAIKDGCTHVLVLCTRPAPVTLSPWVRTMRSTISAIAKQTLLNAEYMRGVWRQSAGPTSDQQLLWALLTHPSEVHSSLGSYVLPLYPAHTAGCHPLCLNPDTLRAGMAVGHEAMAELLGPLLGRTLPPPVFSSSQRDAHSVAAAAEAASAVASGAAAASAAGMGPFGCAELYTTDIDVGLQYRP